MRLLYLPNEPTEGWQVGARTALTRLRDRGELSELAIYSFLPRPPHVARAEILERARAFRPDVILVAKVGRFPVDDAWLVRLRATSPDATLAYYDGDHYGRVFKRVPEPARAMCRHADLVYLCGLGDHARLFERYGARRILYLPHNASLAQFGGDWTPTRERAHDVIVIGNRIRGRFELQNRVPWARMPGAYQREQLVRRLGETFGGRFAVYGDGWDGFVGARGPVPFARQHEVLRDSWLSVGYDHFPGTPCYFSDRLPIALSSGVAHVTHYHPGYVAMFQQGRELLWSTSVSGLVDTVRSALRRGPEFLDQLGARGRAYALSQLTSEVVFERVVREIRGIRETRAVTSPRPQRSVS